MTEQEKQNMINQVSATMAIENMSLTKQAHENLTTVASGEKTTDQMAEEIKRRYTNV